MAGLGALLGGYGSDDDSDGSPKGASPAAGLPLAGVLPRDSDSPSGGLPAAPQQREAAAAGVGSAAASPLGPADSGGGRPRQAAALRVMDGPTTNPEPPPEGLSPPLALHRADGDSSDDGGGGGGGEGGAGRAANGADADARCVLPPELAEEPPGEPHPHVLAQVLRVTASSRATGKTPLAFLRQHRGWNNPHHLEKIVQRFGLDQYGSSFSPGVWDPGALPEEDQWEALAAQLAARKRPRGGEVRFQAAGQQLQQQPLQAPGAAGAAAAAGGGAARLPPAAPKVIPGALLSAMGASAAKKSKWDK